jgi:outer membrane protein TolC
MLGLLLGIVPGAVLAQQGDEPSALADLLAEAIRNNPEIAAARSERDAAQQRISPAGAFDDPMLEAGVVNAPLPSLSLSREEMTMKMLGLGQKLPYPGKRDLRRSVAAADARSVEFAFQEAINRTVRDVRIVYADLGFNTEARRILADTEAELVQLAAIARSRYDVGQAVQNDVLDAQTEVERLRIERLQLERDAAALQAEMRRLLGRVADGAPINVSTPDLIEAHPDGATLHDEALDQRPQLLALETQVERGDKAVALAEREYYPDFDVRLQYGQRDRGPDGMPRDDMVTLTVALNLPIWRKSRLEPMVAEARAMRNGARSMLIAQQLETQTAIDTRLAEARQWRDSAEIYRGTVLPQVRASVVSALAAYRVGRVDFLTLRQAQLRELEVSTQLAEAIASHNKAVAELDLLLGRSALLPTD